MTTDSEQLDMTPADVLRAAADELMLYGWTRGTQGMIDGPKCLEGALRMAVTGHPQRALAIGVPWDAHTALERVTRYGIVAFNDGSCRRRDQAVAKLLTAAAKWEADHAP